MDSLIRGGSLSFIEKIPFLWYNITNYENHEVRKMKKRMMIISTLMFCINNMVYASGQQDVNELKDIFQSLLGAFSWLGMVIALGALILMGVKYVTSAANEKANLKQRWVVYLIGIFLIGAASAIVGALASVPGDNSGKDVIDAAVQQSGATRVNNSQEKK